jgi:hypothetical protein
MLLSGVTAAACAAPAPAAKVSYRFDDLTFPTTGPGIKAGENAALIYSASNVPSGGKLVIQRGTTSGKSTKWATVLNLPRQSLGRATLTTPLFGRNTYRIAALDKAGKLLASAAHTLDVYHQVLFSDMIGQPERRQPIGSTGASFDYDFRGEVYVGNTTCRLITDIEAYNAGPSDRVLTVSHRLKDNFSTPMRSLVPVTQGRNLTNLYYPKGLPLTIGEDFDVNILDNDLYGATVYAQGAALCFTANGQF